MHAEPLFLNCCSTPTRTGTERTKNSSANHYTMEQTNRHSPRTTVQNYKVILNFQGFGANYYVSPANFPSAHTILILSGRSKSMPRPPKRGLWDKTEIRGSSLPESCAHSSGNASWRQPPWQRRVRRPRRGMPFSERGSAPRLRGSPGTCSNRAPWSRG